MRLRKPLLDGESNPAAASVRPGGVAHNVWRALRLVGADAQLVSLPAHDSRFYVAIEHGDGSLAHGIACLDAYEQLNAAFLSQHMELAAAADVLVADGNCTPDFFAALPTHACLALVAVSPAKMRRMADALGKASWLFCNRAEFRELQAISGHLGAHVADHLKLVETRGKDGLTLHWRGQIHNFPAPQIDVAEIDETGMGDAMAACILAHVTRAEPVQAVSHGLRQFPSVLTQLVANATSSYPSEGPSEGPS